MSTAARIVDPRVMTIEATDDEIIAHLDGRTISVPLVWPWRLTDASRKQRQHWEILDDGEGVRWPVCGANSSGKNLEPQADF